MMAADCEKRRHLWQATSCMDGRAIYAQKRHLSEKGHLCRAPSTAVIPGRREAASPESINTDPSDPITTQEYGFRAPAFGRPRNDGCGF